MKPTLNKGKTNKDLTDKYYFAAYLNMSRHNVYLLLADINTRLGFEKTPLDDADIISMKVLATLQEKQGASPDVQLKVIKELHSNFPFLKTMMFAFVKPKGTITEEDLHKVEYAPKDYYNFFAVFLKTINLLRNEYTHTVAQPFDFDERLLSGLRVTFDAGVRRAKTRFNFSPEDLKHLVRQGKLGKERLDFRYKFQQKDSKQLTIYGLSFFICMLLERKYTTLFTQQIQGLKDKRARKFKATYEVFAINSINLPKVRYTSDVGDGALLLDMLNELKKCPDDLFQQLPAKRQDAFRILASNLPDMDMEQDGDSGFVLLKRYEDRFVYFGLRFLDEVKWFSSLHFPVDLGNYHYYLYDKTVDGVERVGSLWEKVIGYGRLPEYQNEFAKEILPEKWKELWGEHDRRKEVSKLPYMPRTTPHYHLPDNNIAIKIVDDVTIWPELKMLGNDKKNKPADKAQPDMLISKYDLFSVVFYGLIVGKERVKKEIESRLINYVKQRKRLYNSISTGKVTPIAYPADVWQPHHNGKKHPKHDERKMALDSKLASEGFGIITADHLPDEIKYYLMGVKTETFEEKAKYRIEDLLDETIDMQERLTWQLGEKRKIGSKKDVEIKAGVLAGFLAKDIMMFQPMMSDVKANGKPTSTLYKVLQAKLALYGANVDTMERTFIECNLIGEQNPHPFLEKVVAKKPKKIIDFYQAYLEERLQYLHTCKEEKLYDTYNWLKNNQAKRKKATDFGTDLAKRMCDLPVVIPRAFFTQLIKNELISAGNSTLSAALSGEKQHNNSYMVLSYLMHVLNDNVQDFYEWERTYKIFNNYNDNRPDKKKTLPEYPLTETERKNIFKKVYEWAAKEKKKTEIDYMKRFEAFEATEKQIRLTKVQDVVTFLMCGYLMKNVNKGLIGADGQFFLKDILPNGEKGILDTCMSNFGRMFYYSYSALVGGIEVEKKGKTFIYQEDLKVKNIGDFNKFIKDRRLNNLLAYT